MSMGQIMFNDKEIESQQVIINLRDKISRLISGCKDIVSLNSRNLKTRLCMEHLQGGTTDTRLKKRSTRAQSSVSVKPTTFDGKIIQGGIGIGAKYLKTHIVTSDGKTSIVIKAKPGKSLAIPLPAAMTPAGVPKGKPRDESVFGNMNMIALRSRKSSKMILYGQLKYQKGKRAGSSQTKLLPLFLLTKKVTIKKRILLKPLLEHANAEMTKSIAELIGGGK